MELASQSCLAIWLMRHAEPYKAYPDRAAKVKSNQIRLNPSDPICVRPHLPSADLPPIVLQIRHTFMQIWRVSSPKTHSCNVFPRKGHTKYQNTLQFTRSSLETSSFPRNREGSTFTQNSANKFSGHPYGIISCQRSFSLYSHTCVYVLNTIHSFLGQHIFKPTLVFSMEICAFIPTIS